MKVAKMGIRTALVAGLFFAAVSSAYAVRAEWEGGCIGTDYVMTDGNGNYVIAHNVKQCGGQY